MSMAGALVAATDTGCVQPDGMQAGWVCLIWTCEASYFWGRPARSTNAAELAARPSHTTE